MFSKSISNKISQNHFFVSQSLQPKKIVIFQTNYSMKNQILLSTVCLFTNMVSAQTDSAKTNASDQSTQNKITKEVILANIDFFKPGSITFYYQGGGDFVQQQISDNLQEQLKADYPTIGTGNMQMMVNSPSILGYQFHVKDKIAIGLAYCVSSVQTPTLTYPGFQDPNDITEYNYRVKLNSFMGSFDYFWLKRTRKKSTFALYSGFAVGVSNVNIQTNVTKGSGDNIPTYNVSTANEGFQLNLIGFKHTLNIKPIRKMGYMVNLGVGFNSVGLSTGLSYTL
jgi:hypothetical protein